MTTSTFAWQPLLAFRVDGEPKGQPRARARQGLRGVYDPGTADGWKALVGLAARPHRPPSPLDEPLRIDIDFYFPRPRTFSKRVRAAYGGRSKDIPAGPVLHLSKPDRDNSEKAALDTLVQCGLLRDDAIVCAGEVRKFYHAEGGRPGAEIRVFVWRRRG